MKKILCALIIPVFFASCKDEVKKETNSVFYNEPALKKVTEEIEKNPDKAHLYFERAVILDHLEMDTVALNDYKKAISLDSTRSEYYSAIGDMLFEHKDVDASIPWLEKALKLNPDDKRAHMKMAKMFLFMKEYTKAFEEINTVLKQDVYYGEGYFLKGMIYKDMNDTSKAISSFQTALQVAPDYRPAMMQLGIMYGMKNDPLALKYYNNAYSIDSTDVSPLHGIGVYYQNREDYELAKHAYMKTIRADRYFISSYYNLGYIYMQQDSLQKAFTQYDIITKLEPQSAEGYFNRGLCYELMGDEEKAVIDYKQALVFDEDYRDPKERLKELE